MTPTPSAPLRPDLPAPPVKPAPAVTLIERDRLTRLLGDDARGWSVEIVDQTGSTNADLTQRLRENRVLDAPVVRVAYEQLAGRGRRGRAWVAAPGQALLFSLAYPMQRPLAALAGLSLAVGTAINAGLRALPLQQPGQLALKWPNDILLDEAKLGGVLIETAWSTAEMSAVVIGIGLNLRGASALSDELARLARVEPQPAPSAGAATQAPAAAVASLDQTLSAPDMTAVLAHVLNALAHTLSRFEQAGFAPFRELWLSDHAYAGRPVVLLENGATLASGTADSVDALGQLLIATAQGVHICAAGDVSLRLRTPAYDLATPATGPAHGK